MPVASVIVPARNAAGTIERTLEGIAGQDYPGDFEVIVVDNGSTDDTATRAERSLERARVVRKEPGRVSSARNRGAAESAGEYLAFIDADCVPSERWLSAGVRALGSADLVQGAVQPDPEASRAPFDRTLSVGRASGLYETANMFVRRATFDLVAGFREVAAADFETPFGEDVWFGWRARRAGAKTAFSADALAYHAVFPRAMGEFVAEHRRRAHFPALVALIPELRDAFLFKRWFLSQRTAAFDSAVLGAALALASRSGVPLALALPYAGLALKEALGWRSHAPSVLAGSVWADAVSFLALVQGSLRARAIVV